jgi:hypothetical protein
LGLLFVVFLSQLIMHGGARIGPQLGVLLGSLKRPAATGKKLKMEVCVGDPEDSVIIKRFPTVLAALHL